MANPVATSHSFHPFLQAGIKHIQGKDQLKPITDVEEQSKLRNHYIIIMKSETAKNSSVFKELKR